MLFSFKYYRPLVGNFILRAGTVYFALSALLLDWPPLLHIEPPERSLSPWGACKTCYNALQNARHDFLRALSSRHTHYSLNLSVSTLGWTHQNFTGRLWSSAEEWTGLSWELPSGCAWLAPATVRFARAWAYCSFLENPLDCRDSTRFCSLSGTLGRSTLHSHKGCPKFEQQGSRRAHTFWSIWAWWGGTDRRRKCWACAPSKFCLGANSTQ